MSAVESSESDAHEGYLAGFRVALAVAEEAIVHRACGFHHSADAWDCSCLDEAVQAVRSLAGTSASADSLPEVGERRHASECLLVDPGVEPEHATCICDRLRAAEHRERFLWESVARERIDDLMSCHKNDDCHARADSIEVLLDDVGYLRRSREGIRPPETLPMAANHLPECPSSSPDPLAADCCCSRLSAVERRILDAAREAVAGLPEVAGWTDELAIIRKPIALDAIDALREKP